MAKGKAPGPLVKGYIPLRKQLRIYEQYIATEDIAHVAKQNNLSPEVTQHIVERVPRELIPLTQLRKAKTCIELEELASAAIERLHDIAQDEQWDLRQCLAVLRTAGSQFSRLISAETPMVQQNVISGEAIATAIRNARTHGESIGSAGGNGNRVRKMLD